jgi:uncharacterized membrane protein
MKMEWFTYALVAMISFTLMFLAFIKIGKLGLPSETTFVYYCLFAGLLALLYSLSGKIPLSATKYLLIFLLLAGLFGAIGNIFLFKAMSSSPNPGYAIAVSGIHVLLVAIVSIFLFKAEFTLIKGLGTIFAVLGIILLGWK